MQRIIKYAILLFGGIYFCWISWQRLSVTLYGARATAVCTQVNRDFTARRTWHTYRLRFSDAAGNEILSKIRDGAFWLNPQEGDSVRILYNPTFPQVVFYDSWIHVWMKPTVIVSVLGFILVSDKFRFLVQNSASRSNAT